MARAFLLLLVGAYLFGIGRQMVSLRWLALFRDFKRAQAANQGLICLADLYFSLDTLSQGTLCQLVGLWKLHEVSFSLFSLVVHAFSFLQSYIHMPYRLISCTIFLLPAFMLISCKLLSCRLLIYLLQTIPYLNLANYHLANCTITSYKLSSCKLLFLNLAHYHLANCHLVNCSFFNLVHYHFPALGYGVQSHCQRS